MGFHGYPAKNIYGYWLTQNRYQNQLPLVPNWDIIGLDDGLSSVRYKAII